MKKAISLILLTVILFLCGSVSAESTLDLSILQGRTGFEYTEQENEWKYFAELVNGKKLLLDGSLIYWTFAMNGNGSEISQYPRCAFMLQTPAGQTIALTQARLLMDGNLFDIQIFDTFNRDLHLGYILLAEKQLPLLRALAACSRVSLIVYAGSDTWEAEFEKDELTQIIQFASDLLQLDYLDHMNPDYADYKQAYSGISPVRPHIFNEKALADVDPDMIDKTEIPVEWKQVVLNELPISFSLPDNFFVIQRGMPNNVHTPTFTGKTADQLTAEMKEENLYLLAYGENIRSYIQFTWVPRDNTGISNDMRYAVGILDPIGVEWMVKNFTPNGQDDIGPKSSAYRTQGIMYSVYEQTRKWNGQEFGSILYIYLADHYSMGIELTSCAGSINEQLADLMQKIVDQVVVSPRTDQYALMQSLIQ